MNFKIDRSKAINTMLFIIRSLGERGIEAGIHKVMKLMYFADRKHLVDFGSPISGDTYQKMTYGPVPSFTNNVANDNMDSHKGIISKNGWVLTANKAPDMDDLSESEVECIENSLDTYSKYTFDELTAISHDIAWNCADWDISYMKIAEEGGADADMMAFIREQIINDNISFDC